MQQKNNERQKKAHIKTFMYLMGYKKCAMCSYQPTHIVQHAAVLTLKFSLIDSTYGTVNRNIFHSLGTACYHMCSNHTKLPNEGTLKSDKHEDEFVLEFFFLICKNEEKVFFSV